MMHIHLITLFPEMFQSLNYGVIGRALQNKILQLEFWNPRDFTTDNHKTVDDRPYGGGPGMVMKVAPLRQAIQAAKASLAKSEGTAKVVYFSPQGKVLRQSELEQRVAQKKWIFLAGRYEGIDQRLIDHDVDEIWSVGDYIVSGGELPIMLTIDALMRLLPEVLNDPESARSDSFTQGLLEYPQYTRPAEIDGQKVPNVLLQGDHQAIQTWRDIESLKNTWQNRPDLLKIAVLTPEQQRLLDKVLSEVT